MEDQAQAQQAAMQQTVVQLNLTLVQVNGILQAMHKAPYELAKPMIDLVTNQAQEYIAKMNATQQAPAPANLQAPVSANQQSVPVPMPNMPLGNQ